jgi:hypothetical protein
MYWARRCGGLAQDDNLTSFIEFFRVLMLRKLGQKMLTTRAPRSHPSEPKSGSPGTPTEKASPPARGGASFYRILTARAARRAMVASEMSDWSIMRTLAQRESTGTSVGEKAVEVLKARKR